ncbi:nucleoside diphosphate kinase 2, chloroplastic isoform X2 [Lolium perenne]|uniref:nucleoside diphosphate kinase 2, chloroplastic isoform X2 n=1 Tax=Lolium perenne TaxID=4522 RepID=UPI0021F5CAEF|nr:nucleoside diphosphate kinase 2, chloroplastic isoform X2 [Lolium perenne]
MDAMAALARTGPSPLAATGHRSSASLCPAASLSFPAASSRGRGRVGLSAAAWSGRAARVARGVPNNRIVASSEIEQSYIMIKPDGVQRGLVGEIISRFEKKGFLLKGLKLFQCPKELAQAWEGAGVVASARKLIGATNPLQAEPGTIRGDLAVQTGRNVIHGSDSPDNGKREIALWFKEGELAQWESVQSPWLIE